MTPKETARGATEPSLLWLAAYKPYEAVARLLLWPLRLLPENLRPRARFLRSASERIGHLAIEPDIFIKELQLGLRPPGKYLWVTRPGKVCNPCLLDYWRPYLKIYDRGLMRYLLLPASRQRSLGIELNEPIIADQKTAGYTHVQAEWGSRPPLLQLREEHRRRGEAALAALGVPPGAWFVCVHNREPGFLPGGRYGDDFRNGDVRTLFPAMEEIVRRGGWCIRMGDGSMTPLPKMRGVIDYAHSSAKSDWMDVYLCGANRFFLGCTSGLALVASVFGKPVAQANAAPFSTILYYGPQDLGIAKLYTDATSGRLWSFPEILGGSAANCRRAEEFAAANLRLRDNSPEEIFDLVTDMFDQIEGRALNPGEIEREKKFLYLMKPGHYAYGSPARVAPSFLRRHTGLIA
jgi:putative glycosyltransferase (TIGR04372 family)